jgi:hypothetical protein
LGLFRSHHGGQYNEDDERDLLLRKFRDTMRDGGWSKNKTARDGGWRVSKVVARERAFSEYQRTHNDRLSAPKRVQSKYEQKLSETRQNFYEN